MPTKFKKIVWPVTPAVYGTPTFVNGKIKGKKVKKRVVVLQQKLPSGWQKVDKDKTNGKGRFHLKAKTTWYHKKIKQRVVVQATRKAAGNTSKGRGFTVNPAYAPQGDMARGPASRRATRSSTTPAPRCTGGSTPSTPPTASSPR